MKLLYATKKASAGSCIDAQRLKGLKLFSAMTLAFSLALSLLSTRSSNTSAKASNGQKKTAIHKVIARSRQPANPDEARESWIHVRYLQADPAMAGAGLGHQPNPHPAVLPLLLSVQCLLSLYIQQGQKPGYSISHLQQTCNSYICNL